MKKTDWFHDCKWGIFTHYLWSNVNTDQLHSLGKGTTDWSECVNEFDVEKYVASVKEAGAGYAIFTIMQGDKYMCAPNAAYDKITELLPGEACSERDLISEIADALEKVNIPLMLYYTGDGPYKNEYTGRMFGYYDRDKQKVSAPFVTKWAEVAKEYSLRYGKKIKGWWVDGCYDHFGYTEEHFEIYSKALKAGNPDAIITFNNGVKPDAYRYSKFEDYTSGEQVDFEIIPKDRFVDGSQWHVLSFLGIPKEHFYWGSPAWSEPGCKYSAKYMGDYVKSVNDKGGVVSVDVCLMRDGSIDHGQIEVLKGIKR